MQKKTNVRQDHKKTTLPVGILRYSINLRTAHQLNEIKYIFLCSSAEGAEIEEREQEAEREIYEEGKKI